MRAHLLGALGSLLLFVCGSGTLHAAEPRAVQKYRYQPTHELSVALGYLPKDPFTKGITGSVAYTIHLSEHLALRVFDVGYAHPSKSNLRRDLENNFAIGPQRFEAPVLLASSQLLWQPLYGRETWLNRSVLTSATYLSAGGGAVIMREGLELNSTPFPAAVLGVGLKIFVTELFAMRLELRDFMVVQGLEAPEHIVWISLAGTFGLGGGK